MDLNKVYEEVMTDADSVTKWCTDVYNSQFASYFADSRELFKQLEDKDRPISDQALTWILISLPINLFEVSEVLNQFRLKYEVVKLRNDSDSADMTTKEKQTEMLERRILLSAFSHVITRVENEISFSRELIMGAKKIWDGRKRAEEAMPVSESVLNTLPKYVGGD